MNLTASIDQGYLGSAPTQFGAEFSSLKSGRIGAHRSVFFYALSYFYDGCREGPSGRRFSDRSTNLAASIAICLVALGGGFYTIIRGLPMSKSITETICRLRAELMLFATRVEYDRNQLTKLNGSNEAVKVLGDIAKELQDTDQDLTAALLFTTNPELGEMFPVELLEIRP